METLDMATILLEAYQLADKINESPEVEEYLRTKRRLSEDQEAQKLIREFHKVKDQFEEAQRFGIFHPNYHEAKEMAVQWQKKLRKHPTIRSYLVAEEQLDRLLHEVSRTIAHAVSESVKVPGNDPVFPIGTKGCGGCASHSSP
jgi:cell fate (sporulation/competence/biofilm development) regulator YlbF (YheA/YmcA/DUF963 family)